MLMYKQSALKVLALQTLVCSLFNTLQIQHLYCMLNILSTSPLSLNAIPLFVVKLILNSLDPNEMTMYSAFYHDLDPQVKIFINEHCRCIVLKIRNSLHRIVVGFDQ